MNSNEFQKKTERTARKFNGQRDAELLFLTSGLAEEAGEVLQLARKIAFKNQDVDRLEMALELGDTLYYLTRLATQFGYTLEEIMQLNIEKLLSRHPEA